MGVDDVMDVIGDADAVVVASSTRDNNGNNNNETMTMNENNNLSCGKEAKKEDESLLTSSSESQSQQTNDIINTKEKPIETNTYEQSKSNDVKEVQENIVKEQKQEQE